MVGTDFAVIGKQVRMKITCYCVELIQRFQHENEDSEESPFMFKPKDRIYVNPRTTSNSFLIGNDIVY